MITVELTEQGRAYAQMTQDESLVSNVALQNESSEWPHWYINLARRVCNEVGEEGR